MAQEYEKKLEILIEKAKINKQEEKLFYDVNLMYNDDTAIIEVGATLENMGQILKTNNGAEKLTGYSSNKLRTLGISCLMPSPFSIKHPDFMKKSYETGISHNLYRELKLFMKRKSGHLLPISMLVKPTFHTLNADLRYITLLQSISSQFDFVMVEENGRIVGLTERMGHFFGW